VRFYAECGAKAISDWATSLSQQARARFGCRFEKGVDFQFKLKINTRLPGLLMLRNQRTSSVKPALIRILSCDSVTAGAFFSQSELDVPEEKMSQHACHHVVDVKIQIV
jgi:hypothetical protein